MIASSKRRKRISGEIRHSAQIKLRELFHAQLRTPIRNTVPLRFLTMARINAIGSEQNSRISMQRSATRRLQHLAVMHMRQESYLAEYIVYAYVYNGALSRISPSTLMRMLMLPRLRLSYYEHIMTYLVGNYIYERSRRSKQHKYKQLNILIHKHYCYARLLRDMYKVDHRFSRFTRYAMNFYHLSLAYRSLKGINNVFYLFDNRCYYEQQLKKIERNIKTINRFFRRIILARTAIFINIAQLEGFEERSVNLVRKLFARVLRLRYNHNGKIRGAWHLYERSLSENETAELKPSGWIDDRGYIRLLNKQRRARIKRVRNWGYDYGFSAFIDAHTDMHYEVRCAEMRSYIGSAPSAHSKYADVLRISTISEETAYAAYLPHISMACEWYWSRDLNAYGHGYRIGGTEDDVMTFSEDIQDEYSTRLDDSMLAYAISCGKMYYNEYRQQMWIHVNLRNRHYFNDIAYTRGPFFIGGFVLSIMLCLVIFLQNISDATDGITRVTLIALILFFITALNCGFNDVDVEAHIDNRYGRKLRAALVCGFVLFIISETMLFGGFFGAFFDRAYSPGYMNSMCMPTGMERIDYWRWPFVGTVILLTSGYYANRTYYELRAGSITTAYMGGAFVLLLAILFMAIQLVEYNGLNLTMSDNVYGSFFYLLTGFHGFHVLVGFLFLCEQIGRCCAGSAGNTRDSWTAFYKYYVCPPVMSHNRDRHLGLAFAVIYWHFIDIVGIFLYINVYVFSIDNLKEGLDLAVYCLLEDLGGLNAILYNKPWVPPLKERFLVFEDGSI